MTLTEFLLARIAEDEEAAKSAARWKWRGPSKPGEPQVMGVMFQGDTVSITWVGQDNEVLSSPSSTSVCTTCSTLACWSSASRSVGSSIG